MSENTPSDLARSRAAEQSNPAPRSAPSVETAPFEDPDDIDVSLVPYIVGSGLCMGTADVVPGVSGGTMAVALGIYRRLLVAIASINTRSLNALARFKLKQVFEIVHWRFLTSLVFGIGLAVVVMIKVVKLPRLIETHPELVYAAFFGLVAGSVVVLVRRVPAWNLMRGAVAAVSVGVGFAVVSLVPVNTPENALFLFLCGMLSISAMLLPGISGSFVLLILGKYEYVLSSLEGLMHLDLSQLKVVVPFALGCLAGMAAFARFLSWLMRRWQDTVMCGLSGLLVGSLWRIWPYQELKQELVRGKLKTVEARAFWPEAFDASVLVLMLLGLAAVLMIEYLARRRAKPAG